MRLRKNAKISTLFFTNTNLSNGSDECLLQKNLCQLNQSPWDIITFPSSDSSPSLHQSDNNEVYYNVYLAGNGSWDDSIGASESLAPVKTYEGENYDLDEPKNDYGEILGFKGGETSEIQDQEIVLCGKRDDKGWQCGRLVKNGDTICDHPISEIQQHEVWTSKKKSQPVNGPRAGSRSWQNKKQASTSPYEFYYYSGFGPSWGKKRGATSTTSNTHDEKTLKEMSSNYNMDVQKEMKKRYEPGTSKIRPTKTELTYVDNDDDDNKKGKLEIVGKKRGRKPIKARSLKSLM